MRMLNFGKTHPININISMNRRIKQLLIISLHIIMGLSTPLQLHGALLSAMYNKMRLIREKNGTDDFSEADSSNAEKGIESAMVKFGSWCIRNERIDEGLRFLKKASTLGNDTAKCYLAEAYYFGLDGNHSVSKAKEIINTIKIKEGSFLNAIIIYDGSFNNQSQYRKAISIFESIGIDSFYHPLACYYLSKCYRYGRGVNRNLDKSIEFMNMARKKPLTARNIEETKPDQFLQIVRPISNEQQNRINRINEELEEYNKSVEEEIKNSTPSFGLG